MNADEDIACTGRDSVCMDVQLLMEEGWGSEQMSQLSSDTSPHEFILLDIYAALGVDYDCGYYRPEEFARGMRDFKRFVTGTKLVNGTASTSSLRDKQSPGLTPFGRCVNL